MMTAARSIALRRRTGHGQEGEDAQEAEDREGQAQRRLGHRGDVTGRAPDMRTRRAGTGAPRLLWVLVSG